MSRVGFLIFLSIYLIAAGSAAQSTEREPADLLTEGTLRIDSRLIPDTGIVPGQKLVLELEVATIRWFAGGIRIFAFALANGRWLGQRGAFLRTLGMLSAFCFALARSRGGAVSLHCGDKRDG